MKKYQTFKSDENCLCQQQAKAELCGWDFEKLGK
ncbi:hypothetical protein QF028_002738 [Neobacillus sp. B4I6]